MLSMRIDTLVAQIVRHELVDKGRQDEALYLKFDLSLTCYNTELQSVSQRRGLHLLYHSYPVSQVITVFSAVTKSPFASIKSVSAWKHETSHDTCWRDVGIFSEVYFEMADCINNTLAENGFKKVAPKDMSEHNSFELWSDLFKWVKVKVTTDETDDFHYRRLVTVV